MINEIGGTIKDITNENKDKTKVLKVIRGVIIDITKVINGIEEQINASWETIIDNTKVDISEEGYELRIGSGDL